MRPSYETIDSPDETLRNNLNDDEPRQRDLVLRSADATNPCRISPTFLAEPLANHTTRPIGERKPAVQSFVVAHVIA